MTYDVLVYGPLFCDLIFTGLPHMPALGTEIFANELTLSVGGSAIVAAGLHRLNSQVGLVCDLGNDPMSLLATQLLDDLNIDRRLIRTLDHPLPQITVALSFPQDRAFVTRFEKPATPIDLATVLDEHPARHVHIGGFLGALDALNAPEIAHSAGATISMDLGWDEVALRNPQLLEMARRVDVFLPSRSELCYMLDEPDAEIALNRMTELMHVDGLVVMKDGSNGAIASSKSQRLPVPAITVTAVDTTGAGDAFDAGFIHAFVQGNDLETCMAYGNICGALTTIVPGGALGTPTLEEVQSWLSKLQS